MSNGIGGTAQWLAGVTVGAAVICWGVIPGIVGLGTQRSPENGDLAKPGDVAQWFMANIARVSGDFAVTFQKNRAQGPVAGSNNLGGNGYGRQYLPQSDRAVTPLNETRFIGAPCAGNSDRNCDGVISLEELEERSP